MSQQLVLVTADHKVDHACRTILLALVYEGLLVGFWFIDHACARSFYP
jgi:hypothetical protein